MLSQTVEYAMRAVVFLSRQAPAPSTTGQIAEATRVPLAYLSKVLQLLVKARLVSSRRGIGGGVTLARNPEHLTLLEVVNAVEPMQRIKTCPLGIVGHGTNLCPLHRRLDLSMAQIESSFGQTTLSQVLGETSPSIPLCEFPCLAKEKRTKKKAPKSYSAR